MSSTAHDSANEQSTAHALTGWTTFTKVITAAVIAVTVVLFFLAVTLL